MASKSSDDASVLIIFAVVFSLISLMFLGSEGFFEWWMIALHVIAMEIFGLVAVRKQWFSDGKVTTFWDAAGYKLISLFFALPFTILIIWAYIGIRELVKNWDWQVASQIIVGLAKFLGWAALVIGAIALFIWLNFLLYKKWQR